MRIRAYYVNVLLAVLLAGAELCVAQAQQVEPPKKPAPADAQAKHDETPAVVPTGALRRGTQMQEAASEELVKWARGQAKRIVLDRAAPDNETVAKAVDTRYPKAPAHAREAGVFLVWYLAYTEGSENQESVAAHVRDLNRQIADLEQQLRLLGQGPRRTLNPARAADAEEARLLQRVEDLTRQRDFHQRQMDAVNARVDICLKRLATLDENLKGRDPTEIRRLK